MAQDRVHGSVVAEANWGYQPVVINVAAVGGFLVDSVAGNGAITKKGYSNTAQVVETFGSIVWMGAQSNNSFTCIVDGPTVNKGANGDFSELLAAVTSVIDSVGTVETQLVTISGTATGQTSFLGVPVAASANLDIASVTATKIVSDKANIIAGNIAVAAGVTDITSSGANLTLFFGEADANAIASSATVANVSYSAGTELIKGIADATLTSASVLNGDGTFTFA